MTSQDFITDGSQILIKIQSKFEETFFEEKNSAPTPNWAISLFTHSEEASRLNIDQRSMTNTKKAALNAPNKWMRPWIYDKESRSLVCSFLSRLCFINLVNKLEWKLTQRQVYWASITRNSYLSTPLIVKPLFIPRYACIAQFTIKLFWTPFSGNRGVIGSLSLEIRRYQRGDLKGFGFMPWAS